MRALAPSYDRPFAAFCAKRPSADGASPPPEPGQVGMARVFHLWVRAYLCSLEANAGVAGVEGAGCRDILSTLKAFANLDSNGRVKMGAVVESFAACPGMSFITPCACSIGQVTCVHTRR